MVPLGEAAAASVQFADAEIPSGDIDGNNQVFNLAHSPSPVRSLQLFCGIAPLTYIMKNGIDFTIEGSQITFTNAPLIGSEIVGWYRY
jgi:hypothetical protein